MDNTRNHVEDRLNPFTLAFRTEGIEADYRHWSYDKNLVFVRIFLIVGVLIHLTILPLEKRMLGPGYEDFWLIRIFILIPACAAIYLASYRPWFYSWNQRLGVLLVLVTGLAMALGIWMYPHVESVHFVRAAVTVVMFSVALLGLHFVNAIFASWVVIAGNLLAVVMMRTNQQLLTSEISILMVFGLTLSFIAYKQERTERFSYTSMLNVQRSERRNQERERERRSWLENLASFFKHEIKNSISGVVTSHRLLQRHIQGEEGHKYLGRAEKSLAMIDELLESVTHATSIETALYAERRAVLNLSQLVTEQVESYKMIYPDVDFVCDLQVGNVKIEGMEERVLQMLDNLIINAIEHNVVGRPVRIKLRSDNKHCKLSIINEGENLPEEQEKMYTLFYTSKAAQTKGHRRGLGLYVVKLIAEGYGGSIMARRPREFNGAEFVISLPLAAQSTA